MEFCNGFTDAFTAENSKNSLSNSFAIILASVVLPDPGGPQKIRDGKNPLPFAEVISFLMMPVCPVRCF